MKLCRQKVFHRKYVLSHPADHYRESLDDETPASSCGDSSRVMTRYPPSETASIEVVIVVDLASKSYVPSLAFRYLARKNTTTDTNVSPEKTIL